MPAIVAPDMARYAINGYHENRPVVNIVDLAITAINDISREEALFLAAGDILNQWSDHVLPNLADNYVATSVSWIDLDSLTGSTGERSNTDGSTWPEGGAIQTASSPGNVAARADKNTVSQRGQRQGRMYVCGIPEVATQDQAPNLLTETFRQALQSALEEFRSGLEGAENSTDPLGSYTSSPNVIHTTGGVYSGRSRITSMTVQSLLGSQRRRLRG